MALCDFTMMLISDSPTLVSFCKRLAGVPYIAVDTEFVRERTYYAQLALIQVAHGEHAAAIDPLAPGIDLTPLKALMQDASVLKVFHAGTEDLELMLQTFEQLPTPIYDTQIAAGLCGNEAQIGYARLVKDRLGITLDKASQRTDWARRPLSDKQLTYALADVTHLCNLYEGLTEELEGRGRTEWANEEMKALSGASRYQAQPEEAWRRVRIRRPTRRNLAVLRELASWREHKARSRNLPRPWVLKNDALVQIAQAMPKTREALMQLSALKRLGGRWRDADRIVAIVNQALESDPETWPALPQEANLDGAEALLKALRKLLNECCEEAAVAPAMVATRRDLERLVGQTGASIPVMSGWRYELFGKAAEALVAAQAR